MAFMEEIRDFEGELGAGGGRPFTKDELETVYAIAFGNYERAEYEKAADIFTHLLLHDPKDIRFWKGLGAAKQMNKDYSGALHAWGVYALLSGHSCEGHYHAAECYVSLGEKQEAKKALTLAKRFLKGGDLEERIGRLETHLNG
jgi:type III secretion system low calcium response chaperone LcrH/SycD